MSLSKLPIFITGNQSKADYLSRQLGIQLDHKKVELDEIQSTDLHEIVAHKLRQAYEICKRPVLVEDVSLAFNALGDLPGPYIKWFVEHAGDEACCRMLDGFSDRSAVIRCTFGDYDGEPGVKLLTVLPSTKSFDTEHSIWLSEEDVLSLNGNAISENDARKALDSTVRTCISSWTSLNVEGNKSDIDL